VFQRKKQKLYFHYKDLVRFAHNWNNGMFEYWNIGEKQEQSFISFKIHHSTIPTLQYSMWVA